MTLRCWTYLGKMFKVRVKNQLEPFIRFDRHGHRILTELLNVKKDFEIKKVKSVVGSQPAAPGPQLPISKMYSGILKLYTKKRDGCSVNVAVYPRTAQKRL